MNEKQEKALLEWGRTLAGWFASVNSAPNIQPEARAYLATLEPKPTKCGPGGHWSAEGADRCYCGALKIDRSSGAIRLSEREKPEPKRGVEEILLREIERFPNPVLADPLRQALRLYREERVRVWGIIANAGFGDWTRESKDWQGAAHRWGVENGFRLERRDAD